jgi:hypothetical protein
LLKWLEAAVAEGILAHLAQEVMQDLVGIQHLVHLQQAVVVRV